MSTLRTSLILFVPLLLISLGCERTDLLNEDLLDSQLASMKTDDLNRTMDFVFSDSRFDQKEFEDKIATGLNRWAKEVTRDESSKGGWEQDPAIKELLEEFADLPVLARFEDLTYLNSDGYYIQEAAWLKKIGERVTVDDKLPIYEFYRLLTGDVAVESATTLEQMVQKLNAGVEGKDLASLANAVRLFDWVTRNIQLIENESITEDRYDEFRVNDSDDPVAAGIPGVGYNHYPWQSLLYARGDVTERAKLFTLLCRQMGMDAAVLAYETDEGKMMPWLASVLIGGKAYLFDTYLGLPLPGKTPGSIATVDELLADPEMLAELDLSLEESTRDNTKYPVRPEQVKNLTAMIYVTPESASRRMQFLETRLSGDNRLRLSEKPSDLIGKFSAIEGLNAKVWDVGFKTTRFRNAIETAIEVAKAETALQEKLQWYYENEYYVDAFVTYRTARNLYFIGKFVSDDINDYRKLNAVEMFYSLMYTDENIDGLATNKQLLYRLGIRQEKDSSFENFKNRLVGVQSQMRLVRRDAGLFLAQSHFDSGNIGTCANWLMRVDEKGISERWNAGIQYLIARSYEAAKEYDKAVEIYSKGEHEQFHGNLIRARLMQKAIGELDSQP